MVVENYDVRAHYRRSPSNHTSHLCLTRSVGIDCVKLILIFPLVEIKVSKFVEFVVRVYFYFFSAGTGGKSDIRVIPRHAEKVSICVRVDVGKEVSVSMEPAESNGIVGQYVGVQYRANNLTSFDVFAQKEEVGVFIHQIAQNIIAMKE